MNDAVTVLSLTGAKMTRLTQKSLGETRKSTLALPTRNGPPILTGTTCCSPHCNNIPSASCCLPNYVYIKHCACNLSWKLIRSFFICYMLHISNLDSAQDKTPQDTSGKGILPKARWNGSCQSNKRCQRTHTGHGVITGQVTVMLHSPVL